MVETLAMVRLVSVFYSMLSKKERYWHLAAWAFLLSLFLVPLYVYGLSQKVLVSLAGLVLYIPVFYFNLLVILPKWVKKRKIVLLLIPWMGLIIFYTTVTLLLFHASAKNKGIAWSFQLLNYFILNTIWVLCFLLVSTAYWFIKDWFYHEKIKQELENQNLRSELLFLKSQINPHMLFNTLNNIYALAYQGSPKTADSVLKLSEMMQYLLYETSEPKVPLQKEIVSIQRFISLQTLGLKEEPALQFSVQGDIGRYQLAPLLLIAFVENIFKHGVLNDKKDPATLTVTVKNKILYFQSRNRINQYLKDETTGIGLANVSRRLTLLYGDDYELTINKGHIYYELHLQLKLE